METKGRKGKNFGMMKSSNYIASFCTFHRIPKKEKNFTFWKRIEEHYKVNQRGDNCNIRCLETK